MNYQNNKLTPLKAIRQYCLWCGNGQYIEVKLCPVERCPLYPLRFGKGIRGKGLRPLKAIRQKCLNCGEKSYADVKNCDFSDCPLINYRFGHNPRRKGSGGRVNPSFLQTPPVICDELKNKAIPEALSKPILQ